MKFIVRKNSVGAWQVIPEGSKVPILTKRIPRRGNYPNSRLTIANLVKEILDNEVVYNVSFVDDKTWEVECFSKSDLLRKVLGEGYQTFLDNAEEDIQAIKSSDNPGKVFWQKVKSFSPIMKERTVYMMLLFYFLDEPTRIKAIEYQIPVITDRMPFYYDVYPSVYEVIDRMFLR